MIKKRKSVKYLSQNPDDYISLKQKVVLYTKLIAKNESGPNSGMNKRLDMLNKRMDDFRVWQNMPYSKRRITVSPAREEDEQ
tara:strand:- start:7153 stop:7398 length:246 start_codon:yes stop_codon:yes gene_type:complete